LTKFSSECGKHLSVWEEGSNKPFVPEDLTSEWIRKYLGD